MLYRALASLVPVNGPRVPKGSLFSPSMFTKEALEMLEARGFVAEIHPPPLRALARFRPVVEPLEAQGIRDLGTLLEAQAIDGWSQSELAGWKELARRALEPVCTRCGGR